MNAEPGSPGAESTGAVGPTFSASLSGAQPQGTTAAARRKLTVYTVLVGQKERLNSPLEGLPAGSTSDLDIDFVCITDNPALRSEVWRFQHLQDAHLPAEKLSRRPKALPHEYFPDTAYSLYIDNTVTLRRLPQSSDLDTGLPYLFRAFRHPSRQTMQEEADAVAMLGYDEVGTICRQLDFYAGRTALDSITPLTAATVLLRSHHDDTVRRFGTLWWESLLAFSKRDQLSIDFALQQAGAQIDYFAGAPHDNSFVHWHGSLGPRRVRASFDAKRYAWLHRADPEAVRDPRAHFLTHAKGSDAPYQRRAELLEYICHRHGSSLGQQVAPRRGMADALQALLEPHRGGSCRYVLARVPASAQARAFDDAELDAARTALGVLMGRDAVGTAIDLTAAELANPNKVYVAQQQPYDLVVVLGAAGGQLTLVTQKLARLLAPGHGSMVFGLTSPASLHEAVSAEGLVAGHANGEVRTTLQGSRHDDEPGIVPNSVIGISIIGTPA